MVPHELMGSSDRRRALAPVATARRRSDLRHRTQDRMTTNDGMLSQDLMDRALPIRLAPAGDVTRRQSPIGNPGLAYRPANRDRIEAELRGMIERWRAAGCPLDGSIRHPF